MYPAILQSISDGQECICNKQHYQCAIRVRILVPSIGRFTVVLRIGAFKTVHVPNTLSVTQYAIEATPCKI